MENILAYHERMRIIQDYCDRMDIMYRLSSKYYKRWVLYHDTVKGWLSSWIRKTCQVTMKRWALYHNTMTGRVLYHTTMTR